EVVVNGDSVSPVASASAGVEGPIPPKTVEQNLARKNELKEKSTLMLAILDEHLLMFHACKDAKSLWEAIKNMFGGNKESKKMQKTILKQNYEKFAASSQKGLDKAYDRFQKLISQLEFHGEVYESEIKSQSSSSSNSQNVAFVSSNNSSTTNETINTAYSVSAASSKDRASTTSYADDVMFYLFSNQSNIPQLDNEDLEQIDTDDLEEMDLKWKVAMLTMGVKRFIKKKRRKLDLNGIETIAFDKTKVECYNCHRRDKTDLGYDGQMNESNLNDIHVNESEVLNNVFESCESDGDDNQVSDRFKKGEGYHAVPSPYTRNYMPSRADLSFAELDNSVFKSKMSDLLLESDSEDKNVFKPKEVKKTVKPSLEKIEFVNAGNTTVENENKAKKPRKFIAVLTKSGHVPVNASKQSSHRAATSVSAARRVNTAASRPNGNPQYALQDQEIFDSGCFRHMTRNKSYLTDYQEIDGGFVAIRGNTKRGKITRKGKIRTRKLDFKDVYLVKELRFNLFSVLQMCDKKNSILFTDTECVVLSSNFKLLDESQVLLKVPRNHNMYNFDLKNLVHVGGLTCLFAKATLDESNLWESNTKPHVRPRLIMNEFCEIKGIRREFSVARTPQQNGVSERKNRILIEATRTMLADSKLPITFCAEAVNTACYVQNKVLVIKPHNKTPYKLFLGRKSALSFMKPFGCLVTILNTLDHLVFAKNQTNGNACTKANIDAGQAGKKTVPGPQYVLLPLLTSNSQGLKSSEDKVADYAGKKSTKVPRKENGAAKERRERAQRNEFESMFGQDKDANGNRMFTPISVAGSTYDTADLQDIRIFSDAYDDEVEGAMADFNNLELAIVVSPIPTTRIHKDHPKEQIIGDPFSAHQTRRMTKTSQEHTMVYRNKKDKRGIAVRNKTRLVVQGYTQEERIDYDKVFAHVSRIEAIGLFLAYASFMGFIVYQMDVKSAFLYGTIKEEVYVCQPHGFEYPYFPDKVYKVEKALYGLHQAPKAWYETLSTYLLENGFRRGIIDKTLFIKKDKGD
nr:putative ribonuclease H-like domain-containing protein [Tanacetum cinerariifolium]